MKKDKPDSSSPEDSRRRAEKRLAKKKGKYIQEMTEQDVRTLVYELQVHQIELEMQNEELKRVRAETEDALCKYTDLYEFAPVGYFTFDRHGTILEVNLAGAALLGVERCNLINKRFQLFVKPGCIPAFNTFCNKGLENNTKEMCEIELMKKGGSPAYVLLESGTFEGQEGKQCRTVITDITAYKHEEEKIHFVQTLLMATSKAEDMQSLLDIILRRVCEVAGWKYGEIWIPSSDGKQLEYGRWYNNLEHLEEFAMRSKEFMFSQGIGIPGRVWEAKQPAWIKDVTLDQNFLRAKIVKDSGPKTAFAFPLFAGEEVVAIVVLYMLEMIEKDEHLANLVSSISTPLGWIVKRKQMEEIIQHMAYNDTLTSLPNRRQFNDCLALELAHARRNKTMLAVMFLDLDGFKVINDSLGHSAGDQALQGIAGRLRNCMREADTVSRFGGDEFAIVLSTIGHAEDAAIIAKKIIEVLRQPLTIGSNELIVTASIGIALFPDDGEYAETLMKHADIAMYYAKESGRNNYQFFVSHKSIE